jgi:hypothetical protein
MTMFQYGLRSDRHAHRARMAKFRQGIRDAEKVHRAIAGKIAMADKYYIIRHLSVTS